jgi:hypothetical protein
MQHIGGFRDSGGEATLPPTTFTKFTVLNAPSRHINRVLWTTPLRARAARNARPRYWVSFRLRDKSELTCPNILF